MKNYICLLAAVFVWCVMLPVLIHPASDSQAAAAPVIAQPSETSPSQESKPVTISYMDTQSGKTVKIELEEYTARALSALMDETAPPEALKAVAVTIRSVVCYRAEEQSHSGYILCDNPAHCFALAEKAHNGGINAVKETRGEMLTYNGTAALALSHLSSRSCTESHQTLPYLSSVDVYDESGFVCYKTEKHLSADEFKAAFSEYKVSFDAEREKWIGETEYTEGGRVYTVTVGGLRFKGTTIARLLDLPSTDFSVQLTENGFLVSCYGNGDGVGLSRCTAVLMATEGKAYGEILKHFYKGTQLSVIRSE